MVSLGHNELSRLDSSTAVLDLERYQFGFRKHHSTCMALMTLVDKITKYLDDGEYVVDIFLDNSKAFDTVNHIILLKKLSIYGIRGQALSWFQSYLDNRQQFVTYNNVRSVVEKIICGVPQGSILGALLFLLYRNDLANVCSKSFPILFADDTNLFFTVKICLIKRLLWTRNLLEYHNGWKSTDYL